MTFRLLPPEELATRCLPSSLASDPCARAGRAIVGQDRARAAVEFGITVRQPGFHLFVMGPSGSGRRSLVRRAVTAHASRDNRRRSDWVYVHHFAEPQRPLAIELAAGRGARLRDDMRSLIEELRTTIPAAFESEEYGAALEKLNNEFKERTESGLVAVGDEAQQHGILMLRTPAGFTFAPRQGDDVMSSDDFEKLPLEQQQHLQQAIQSLQERLIHALRATMRLRKDHADRLRALNRSTTQLAVDHALDEVQQRYADVPAAFAWLSAVRAALIDHADAFRARDEEASAGQPDPLARYEVNLLVDAGGSDGAPIVESDLPTVQHLLGRIDHVAHLGTLVTDFRLVKAGALHRANGGYLMIDALALLQQPFAWTLLKRALLRREVRISSMAELFVSISTLQLEPQPIPLDVKVILVGERPICQLLQQHDPDFDELFRVVADLDDDLPRNLPTQCELAATLREQAREAALLPPDDAALAALIDEGARRSGDANRISARVRLLIDVLREADHRARAVAGERIGAGDVKAAITARRERAARVEAHVAEAMRRGVLRIATEGCCAGQVNGLAAYSIGDELFGVPARITATARLGDGQVIDIQRETRMSGPVHAKGVLILSSFLASRFSRHHAQSIVGTLVFEQTYGPVEGDSASLAELVALMSAIGELPLRQSLAITGSVDQFGHVQAVGAVNEKVEAFFDLCRQRGLDGTHGAVVPASNAAQLMLREDLVDAVRAGRFAVHAVATVDDALELLTGLPAGDPAVPSDATIHGRIAKRLSEFHALRQGKPRFVRRPAARRNRRLADDEHA